MRNRRRALAWIPEVIELEPFTGSFYQGVVQNMIALGRAKNAETYQREGKNYLKFDRRKDVKRIKL